MEMKLETFEKILSVNLKSVFLFIKAAAKIMIQRNKGGKINYISSIDAIHPSSIGSAAYDASKHGVWGLRKILPSSLPPTTFKSMPSLLAVSLLQVQTLAKLRSSDMETLTKKLIRKNPNEAHW